ncbi:hypothetical protein SAMN04487901_1163 [Prevotella communis]|uniref:Uncharacterized protein n=1 Tax=Prevotella communis TaxID=2913614 RepID=A0A1G7ZGH4_9BACT|nr:hypothetical protein [Prevotella communis]SDH07833.1 hypothetical protein SAMN04487901_1163 [Prevotella communis]
MDKLTIKNRKSDIEAMLNCFNKAIEKKTQSVEHYASSGVFGQMFYDNENELLSIAVQCRDNMSFIYDVLDNKLLESEIIPSNNTSSFYSPRKISLLEIGKYRTEIIRIKKDFDSLVWYSRISGSTERESFFKDCVSKLNYVYSNIAKLAK